MACVQGHPTDAWDFLVTQRFATAQAEGERRAIMGSIRVYSWADVGQPDEARPSSARLRFRTHLTAAFAAGYAWHG